MNKASRISIFISYLSGSIIMILLSLIYVFKLNFMTIISDWVFILLLIFYLLSVEELYRWVKNGQRSEMSDLVAIFFFFFLIFFISNDILTSILGAFSIYLWFGIYELREYPVLNKILIISLITYNLIFISGLISSYLGNPKILNTTFAFSFWIILGLGFLLFGRKYLVIWRFMSPEYLTLFLYIIAWLAVVFIDEFTIINFVGQKPMIFSELRFQDLFLNIYFVLIVVNWLIYFVSGPILDSMLGIKRIKDQEILNLVDEVKSKIKIKGKIKAGFGRYPIINAMAYGSFLDKRIAIISDDLKNIPQDEIKGIIAHELSHTKGKHTLLLTAITSLDLIFRMVLGIPATFYDYTFGNPQIPLVNFILLNFGIYIIIFIFVRILEGKADKKAKESGYGKDLIKALYSLESFYATGREIGLNTMLLCDEQITEYNKMKNYIDTADYLNNCIIKPSKLSLLSNLLNSHPPTYYRIASVLDNKLTPSKEALLPFICLRKSKQRKYAMLFEDSRDQFRKIALNKFNEQFQVEDFSKFLDQIKRREIYQLDLGTQFLFKHKIDTTYKIGTLIDIKFQNDVCDKDLFIIRGLFNNEVDELNASFYEKSPISLDDQYYFENDGLLTLTNIELNSDKRNGKLIFLDADQNEISKDLSKTKLPYPISFINNLKEKDVFFKLKGGLNIYFCQKVEILPNLRDSYLELQKKNSNGRETHIISKLRDLIIKPRSIYLLFRKSKLSRVEELAFINWIKSKQLRSYIQLKKPVNNVEIGYFIDLKLKFKPKETETKEEIDEKESRILIKNIFNQVVEIPYNTIELISFEYNTVVLQQKTDTSFFSKIAYKLMKRFKPHKIIYL